MAIWVYLNNGAQVRVDGGRWNCLDAELLKQLQGLDVDRSDPLWAYIPDYDAALAQTAAERFGGRVVDRRRTRHGGGARYARDHLWAGLLR